MRTGIIGFAAASGLTLIVAGLALSMDRNLVHFFDDTSSKLPIEGGQSAFAALAEIVALLEADPNTDWSQVSIAALRQHLVDMNELTLKAQVEQKMEADRMVFSIHGNGKTLSAIQRMVPAHAGELNKFARWSVRAQKTADGASLVVKPEDVRELQKISALGFFGLMATGAHHQPHHLAMATGTLHAH